MITLLNNWMIRGQVENALYKIYYKNLKTGIEKELILSKEKVIIQVSPEKKSNIVHTVTIKDAIMKCLDHEYIPGIYSLVNNPQWTWKDVIDYYKKPETIIEYKPQIIIEDESQQSIQNENSFFWHT